LTTAGLIAFRQRDVGVAATRIGPSGVHTCSRADAKAVQVFAGTLAERAERATDDFAVRTTASAVIGVAIGVWRTEVDGPTRNLALFEAGLASRRRSPAVSPTSSDQAPAHGCRSRSTRCRVFHDRLAAATPLRPAWPCICPHVGGTALRSGQPPSAGPPHGGGERDAAGASGTVLVGRRADRRAGYAAAALALLYAAVSVYWTLSGTALLSTVGGWVEDLARRGGATAVAVGLLAAAVKMAGAMLALALVHPAGRQADRDVDEEDPAPAGTGGEDSADEHPRGEANAAEGGPHAQRLVAFLAVEDAGDG
jgi:hypothetical protein